MLRSPCNRAQTDVRCLGLLGSIRILGADLLIKTISIAVCSYHLLGPYMQFISLGGTEMSFQEFLKSNLMYCHVTHLLSCLYENYINAESIVNWMLCIQAAIHENLLLSSFIYTYLGVG